MITMRLKITKSKNASSLYVIKSTYVNGKNSSKIVEKLGTYSELQDKLNGQDPIEWAKKYIEDLNRQQQQDDHNVIVNYSPTKLIPKNEQLSFNGGYLFLQQLYHNLGIHKICKAISNKYNFAFDLDCILSRLIYGRIIFPSSKLATYHLSKKLIEQPNFDLQHIYRALEVIARESDFIQSSLYQNSLAISDRHTGVLYYDCTNFFFEIEQEDGLKQYGISKEHRPNPIVQMGLFMDRDGIPLAFSIHKGNTNEQLTLKPLEKKILADFNCSRFIVCTDAGLASTDNRLFNTMGNRAFITTQSIKKLKKHLRDWALSPQGWKLSTAPYSSPEVNISQLDETVHTDAIFYKERWVNENGLEQKLIVTYSAKYKNYQRKIRNAQIERAQKTMNANPARLKKANSNDYKRFIQKTSVTLDGEVASKDFYTVNQGLIAHEEIFDGFYAVCTNLDDDAAAIIKVNQRRWEIEECFRIMKSEFKARPVYLTRDDRIQAHFTTCFLSLVLYRFLEKKLNQKFTCTEIVDGLRDMNFYHVKGDGYIPTYTRTDFTDHLHDVFGFRTDYQILSTKQIKKIFKATKF